MGKGGRPSTTEGALRSQRKAGRRLLMVVAVNLGIPGLLRAMAGAVEWVCWVVWDRRKRGGR